MTDRLNILRKIIKTEIGLDVASINKTNNYVFARAVYYKIARNLRGENGEHISLSAIGRTVKKDHASVIHSLKYSFDQAMNEPKYKSLYNKLSLMVEDPEWNQSKDFRKHYKTYTKISDIWKQADSVWERYLKLKARAANNPVLDMMEGLSEEEVNEVAEKLNIMVKAIKNRVYR